MKYLIKKKEIIENFAHPLAGVGVGVGSNLLIKLNSIKLN